MQLRSFIFSKKIAIELYVKYMYMNENYYSDKSNGLYSRLW